MLKAAPSRMGARDGGVSDTSADIAWQEFSVPYRFPVTFTDGLFEGSNRTLRDSLCAVEEKKRHRCVFFVDDGLTKTFPSLLGDISAYCDLHNDAIDLVADPIEMPGGEIIKSDIHFVERMQQVIFDHHIDFKYRAELGNGLIEHEIDHVFSGCYEESVAPDSGEVAEDQYVEVDELAQQILATRNDSLLG